MSDVLLLTVFTCFTFLRSNSTQATSGINGAGTQTQLEAGIPDTAKIFFEDTKKSVHTIHSSVFYPVLTAGSGS